MSDSVKSPPAWARNIFYLLIVSVLLICVATFILRAACLFTEPDVRSITFAIVTSCVGLSLICGILWIGGVTSLVKLAEGTQKALWVTLIAAVLATTVTVFKGFFGTPTAYKVTGVVAKMDGKDPRDIVISTRFPPLYPAPLVQKNVGLDVSEEPNGKLPTLAFSHPAYLTAEIDLNDRKLVERQNGALTIIRPIHLVPAPGTER